MKCTKIQWRHAIEPFPVDKNEKIAKLVFQIITNEEPTDEMLDKMEIDLKNNTTTKEAYVETATEKLSKFGNVIECVYD